MAPTFKLNYGILFAVLNGLIVVVTYIETNATYGVTPTLVILAISAGLQAAIHYEESTGALDTASAQDLQALVTAVNSLVAQLNQSKVSTQEQQKPPTGSSAT